MLCFLCAPRHVAVLYIKDCTFKMESLPLKTVRPFVMDSISLAKTGIPPQEEEQVMSYLSEKVDSVFDLLSVLVAS